MGCPSEAGPGIIGNMEKNSHHNSGQEACRALLEQLKDGHVRDLAWAIGSPSLIDPDFKDFRGRVVTDAYCKEQLAASAGWLMALDEAPQPLHEYIRSRESSRLGRYFERLIEFWLRHRPDVEELSAGEPVRRGSHNTLGEYDFIFREKGQWRHWETVVKFYLRDPRGEGWHDYVGPGARDRLAFKIGRVFEHQLALSQTPEGKQVLGERQPVSPLAFFKGYLFAHAMGSDLSAPGVSPRHLSGWWCRAGSPLPSLSKDSRWHVLPRLRWLSPCLLDAGSRHCNHEEMAGLIDGHFASSSEPVLAAELAVRPDGSLTEISRGFVVGPDWPEEDSRGKNMP